MTAVDSNFRGRIYDDIIDTIGATPLVRLSRLAADAGVGAEIIGKLEFFNPLASVKDRIGVAMIDAMEQQGKIKKGTVLVEPTSGNTGIGLAVAAIARGYRLILAMPEFSTIERRRMLALLGAEIVLTPAATGMRGALAGAQEIIDSLPDAVMPRQFDNLANPEIHRKTTGEEIWRDTGGKLDYLVSAVGTGGTLSGCAEVLKPRIPELKVIAVEPDDRPIPPGTEHRPHKIHGIGTTIDGAALNKEMIDEAIVISDEVAYATARKAARLEGLAIGVSAGAALAAALELAGRPGMAGKRIVAIVPDFAERYLSTALFEGL